MDEIDLEELKKLRQIIIDHWEGKIIFPEFKFYDNLDELNMRRQNVINHWEKVAKFLV